MKENKKLKTKLSKKVYPLDITEGLNDALKGEGLYPNGG